MLVALIVLILLLLIFGGGGFLSASLNILWWLLIIGLVLWVLGFFFRGASRALVLFREVALHALLQRGRDPFLPRGVGREPRLVRVAEEQRFDQRPRHLARVVHPTLRKWSELDEVSVHVARWCQRRRCQLIVRPDAAVVAAQARDQRSLEGDRQRLALPREGPRGV